MWWLSGSEWLLMTWYVWYTAASCVLFWPWPLSSSLSLLFLVNHVTNCCNATAVLTQRKQLSNAYPIVYNKYVISTRALVIVAKPKNNRQGSNESNSKSSNSKGSNSKGSNSVESQPARPGNPRGRATTTTTAAPAQPAVPEQPAAPAAPAPAPAESSNSNSGSTLG